MRDGKVVVGRQGERFGCWKVNQQTENAKDLPARYYSTACTLKAVNNALFPKWFPGVKTARLISPKPLLVGEDAFQEHHTGRQSINTSVILVDTHGLMISPLLLSLGNVGLLDSVKMRNIA